jgi:hypothetical protein
MTTAAVISVGIVDSVWIAPGLRRIRTLPEGLLENGPICSGIVGSNSSAILETYRRHLQNLQNPDERARPAQP